MIEFYGTLSKECFANSTKLVSMREGIVFLFVTIPSIIITIFIGIYWNSHFTEFLSLSIILVILNILFFVCKPKSIILKLPKQITINNDIITQKTIGLSNGFKPKIRSIEKVKNIIDKGDWYLITFKWDVTDNMVIQKDLITKGTIEEFEKLFEGKIIRKNQK